MRDYNAIGAGSCVRCGKDLWGSWLSGTDKIKSHNRAVCGFCTNRTKERFCLSCDKRFYARENYRICDPCKINVSRASTGVATGFWR